MELKTARLTLLIDPNKKAAFERLCAKQDRTASQVVRQLIREYLVEHGVQFVASGDTMIDGDTGGTAPAPQSKRGPKPKAALHATTRPTRRKA
jgi:Ribbon-helix-helix protein